MARQKPGLRQINAQDTDKLASHNGTSRPEKHSSPVKAEVENDDVRLASSKTSEDDVSDQEEPDNSDIPDMEAEDLLRQGLKLEKMYQLDDAIEYFEFAVRKKVIELSSNVDGELAELHPEMAEYWMRYGDAIFTRIEATEELFNVEPAAKVEEPSTEEDDDKKLAWESMDTARVCFDQLAASGPAPGNAGSSSLIELMDRLATVDDQPAWPLKVQDLSERDARMIKMLVYCRMRLGDFKMAFSIFQDAVEEFAAALVICERYGLEYAKALDVALPLSQCLMANQSEASVNAFKACLKLIRDEKALCQPDEQRQALLTATYEDLERQLEEHQRTRNQLQEQVQEAIEHVQGAAPTEDRLDIMEPIGEDKLVTDLGIISKRRRKDDGEHTTAASPMYATDERGIADTSAIDREIARGT